MPNTSETFENKIGRNTFSEKEKKKKRKRDLGGKVQLEWNVPNGIADRRIKKSKNLENQKKKAKVYE
jgi:hypothetical protein